MRSYLNKIRNILSLCQIYKSPHHLKMSSQAAVTLTLKLVLCLDGARLFVTPSSASAVESLQSAQVGVFTPWESANTPNGALTIRACFSTFSSPPLPKVEFKIQGVFS